MTKKILLIDVDSTIPNLALMKISAYHKSKGDIVGFEISNPDIVYSSIVFDWNSHKADGLRILYPNAHIDVGGQGYSIDKKLPIPESFGGDLTIPDYSIYPDIDYDLGFTSRGCIRNCYFCNVCQLEGKFKPVQHPSEFHNTEHEKVMYLDNNILLDEEWFMEVTDWVIDNKLKIDFSQGIDIRLMNPGVAKRLSELQFWRPLKFAYDDKGYTKELLYGIECLKNENYDLRHNALVYVYMHDDSQFQDAYDRCNVLKEQETNPFVTINMNSMRTQRMADLKRWCIPQIFWSCTFEEYQRKKGRKVIHGNYIPKTSLKDFF